MSGYNPGGPQPPKKETVYDGPDPFATSSSSNPSPTSAAPAPAKKETVFGQAQPTGYGYTQPTPPPPPMKQETVYGGPNPAQIAASGQTVFDQRRLSSKTSSNAVAMQATEAKLRRASIWFFVTAGLLGLEAVFFHGDMYTGVAALLGPSAAILAIIYVVLGFSARQMNPTIFLVAAIAYALHMMLYLFLMFTTSLGFLLFLRPLVVKGYILFRLWGYYHEVKAYNEPDLA